MNMSFLETKTHPVLPTYYGLADLILSPQFQSESFIYRLPKRESCCLTFYLSIDGMKVLLPTPVLKLDYVKTAPPPDSCSERPVCAHLDRLLQCSKCLLPRCNQKPSAIAWILNFLIWSTPHFWVINLYL